MFRLLKTGIGYSFMLRLWGVVAGLVMVAIIVTTQSKEFQGVYYTLLGLLIVQQFADGGFTAVFLQFLSHEWHRIAIVPGRQTVDTSVAVERYASLVRYALSYYPKISFGYFAVITPLGFLLVSSVDMGVVSWRAEWLFLSVFSAFSIVNAALNCLMQGSGRIRESQRNQLLATVPASVAGWAALLFGMELWSLVLLFGLRTLLNFGLAIIGTRPIWLLIRESPKIIIEWKQEFLPQQRRIFTSFLAGFFSFQSFVPVIFYVSGPEAAGQVGVTLQSYQAVERVASAWLVTAQVRFGELASVLQIRELQDLVSKTIMRSTITATVAVLIGGFLVGGINIFFPDVGERFLEYRYFVLFVATAVPLQYVNVTTSAVRFFKVDPFMKVAIFFAALVFATTFGVAKLFGPEFVSVSFFLSVSFVLVPVVCRLYNLHVEYYR